MENALIIFVKNLEKGKVKTRLAKDLGDDQTLEVYKYLLQYTSDVVSPLHCNHFVFYSHYVHLADVFDDHYFTKFVQEGDDLGERMQHAFEKVFALGCKKVCIIGSDCYSLKTEVIQQAFTELDNNDIVIGPTVDGGYYLLGMKQLLPGLFTGKDWGTASVFDDTIQSITNAGLRHAEIETLNDIDILEDLLETDILEKLKEQSL